LKETLLGLARSAPSRSAAGRFRLPVDRVFSMKGFGTVTTGTITTGSVGQDDEIQVLPRGLAVRVRGVQVHGHRAPRASAGQRAALNLTGVEVADLARGDVLVEPGRFAATRMLDCELEVLASSPVPMKDLARVHLHLATAQVLGRVRLLGGVKSVPPGDRALVQLRLEEPLVAARGDRFILRRYSPLQTIAGGVVLDAYPQKHSVVGRKGLEAVESLRDSDPVSIAERFVVESGASGLSEDDLGRRLGAGASELESLVTALLANGRSALVSRTPRVLISATLVDEIGKKLEAALREFHRKNPLLGGMPRSELREKASSGAASIPGEIFDYILSKLEEKKRLRSAKDLVSLFDHRIQLSDDESRARDLLLRSYEKAGVRPPSLPELASEIKLDEKLLERVQRVLLKEGALVQISEGMVFHRDSLSRLKESVRSCKPARGRIDVAFFKEMAGVTRKHAIPLLEWLDRERVTQRAGNERVIL
jgi:selenocysteine-specific elongation factor